MIQFYFNNKASYDDFELLTMNNLEMGRVEEIEEEQEVEGNPFGTLIIKTESYRDLKHTIPVRVKREGWEVKRRLIENWLSNIEDNRLILSDNDNICSKVKKVSIGNYSRNGNVAIEFEITFLCEPFYFDTNDIIQEWDINTPLMCDSDIDTLPIIELNSQGATQITINDETLSFTHTGDVIIDSMRNIFNKENMQVITSTGDLPIIKRGKNTLSGSGFTTLKINTRNRYRG